MDKTVISIRIFLANCKTSLVLSCKFFVQMDNAATAIHTMPDLNCS
jgi:hypothetical protein